MKNTEIKVAETLSETIVDGPGLRFSLYVQGCPHDCEGCHNPQTHSFEGGRVTDIDALFAQMTENPLLDGVTFSGGEPFCQAHALARLGERLGSANMNIVTYTGYTFEELVSSADDENGYLELLSVTDILIDGRFESEQKDLTLKFRGSSNQRILDCRQSLILRKAVLLSI